MTITETDIRQWADRQVCRNNLPILVRRLIRESTPMLERLRFPGNEAVDLAGLDGQAETNGATLWVPEGRSFWEMGCNLDPQAKVTGDYNKRTDETPEDVRRSSSFVFVTPRRWQGKEEWLQTRRDEAAWSNVFAFDAIDLETWLEEAPVTSRWLGELLGVALPGLLTPLEWWQQWSTVSVPAISTRLVSSRRHNEVETLLSKLRAGDPVVPVQADDRGEAVAFVVASMIEANAYDLLDRTLVVTVPGTGVPDSRTGLIAIADLTDGQEPEFGDRTNKTIVRAYPKGRLDVQEPLLLSHVPSEVFRAELEALGLSRDDAEAQALRVGHSIPVLRRQLSPDPEVRRPPWARDRASAKELLPFALAGSWVEREDLDDKSVVQLLGDVQDHHVDRIRDELLALNDAPIARFGNVNVLVSQLDALFAIGPHIERADLDRFFQLLPELLAERDPALDLPQDQWWMAGVLGAERPQSGTLLSGLLDALCILAVHGAEICGARLQVNISLMADRLVRALMADADGDRWLTIRSHLRMLAEASPNAFLDCLEAELRKPEPDMRSIMGVAGGPVGGECLRTNLLWALELLAWDPAHFPRVARIAFDLQRIKIDDNWGNSPISTSRSLFRVWLPSTALDNTRKLENLRQLSEDFRGATIDVCTQLLPGGGPNFASRNARPRWRLLDQKLPEPTNEDVLNMAVGASGLLLDMAPYSKSELGQLLEVAARLHPGDLPRLVGAVEIWADAADDDDKAEIRHVLRGAVSMRAYREDEDAEELIAAYSRMETVLNPVSAVARHRWLFDEPSVEWRALIEEEGEDRLSWQEREERVRQRRAEALEEIATESGDDEVFAFAMNSKRPETVAQTLVTRGTSAEQSASWIRRLLASPQTDASNTFARQILLTACQNDLWAVVAVLQDEGGLDEAEARTRLAKLLPGQPAGWAAVAQFGRDVEDAYWATVQIRLWNDTPAADFETAVQRLLASDRPRSAFFAASVWPERISPRTWVNVLQEIAMGKEADARVPDIHDLEEVFQALDAAEDVTDAEIAGLELPYMAALSPHGHRNRDRTLAVHRELNHDPGLFAQLLSWHYRRSDGNPGPGGEKVSDERKQFLADIAYHALEGWNAVPGTNTDGELDETQFFEWMDAALIQAEELDRKAVAEVHLSAVLARLARRRNWEDWLPGAVLDFLEREDNAEIRRHFQIGVNNARGTTTRGPYDGGQQERVLAARYRELAQRHGNSHPLTAAMLISIAEGYEADAGREDERAALGERWHP